MTAVPAGATAPGYPRRADADRSGIKSHRAAAAWWVARSCAPGAGYGAATMVQAAVGAGAAVPAWHYCPGWNRPADAGCGLRRAFLTCPGLDRLTFPCLSLGLCIASQARIRGDKLGRRSRDPPAAAEVDPMRGRPLVGSAPLRRRSRQSGGSMISEARP